MGWDLDRVKPHVKRAGEYYGKKYSVKNIGGWRAQGSVPGSLHPKGRALDLMTSSRSKGDAIAEDAVRNAKAWGITQVIWWRRIWTADRGWHDYNGPSDHTDHVHLSFADKAGTGKPDDSGPLTGAIGAGASTLTGVLSGISGQIKELAVGVASVGKLAETITRAFLPSNLLRAGAATAGTLFILIGIFFLSREARHG